jgi:two-component system chemotaxis response regulator CheB
VPVAVVLHMPVGYTDAYAKRLDEVSALTVTEAQDGEELRPGVVLVAQAGRHLTFQRQGSRVVTRLDLRPLDTPHRPSWTFCSNPPRMSSASACWEWS